MSRRGAVGMLVDKEKKAHYIAVVKQNHRLLHARVKTLISVSVGASELKQDQEE